VIKDETNAPVVAFRKRHGTKTKDHHIEKAQEMGRFLRLLAPYLPLAHDLPKLEFSSNLYGWITKFNQSYKNLSSALLGDVSELNARDYIKKTEDGFESPFFETLRHYLKQTNKGTGIVQSVIDISLLDAKWLSDTFKLSLDQF